MSPTEWPQQFFGRLYAEIYRRHLLTPERARKEAAFTAELLGLRFSRVLDLACGYGRHARFLAKTNEVWGVDRNRHYLEIARRGLKGAASRNLHRVRGDMRDIPFCDLAFDAVLLLFNSFGYFTSDQAQQVEPAPSDQPLWKLPQVFYDRQLVPEDFGIKQRHPSKSRSPVVASHGGNDENARVLREIARVLKLGAGLLLEAPNPQPLLRSISKQPRRHLVTRDYEIQEEYDWNPASGILHNRTRFQMGQRREEGEYHLRLYKRAELRALLKSERLQVVATYGNYDGQAYSAAESDIILIHAQRRR
jgi:SAM-dependent methyltransferase